MEKNNIYDIIIEKVRKEWYNSMINGSTKEKWEIPRYTKKQIERAGKSILNYKSEEEKNQAIAILNNWRASHAYPLQVISSNLRLRNPNAIVVQRLKRLESIIGKLVRFDDMSLYRMQDLGGCRVIVDSINEVYASLSRYKESRIRHVLKREDDYIQNPQTSGYRSYHMVYKFHSDRKETYNKNIYIEIQFRTKLQHMWATAVEMMGIYTKSNLKSSQGDKNFLRFFVLVSSLFAIEEGTPLCPNTPESFKSIVSEIKKIDRKTNIVSILSALNASIEHISKKKVLRNGYYILILDYEKRTIKILCFEQSEIEMATKTYGEIEQMIGKRGKKEDAVLVSASTFELIKLAYPNYFIDIKEFVNKIRKILE